MPGMRSRHPCAPAPHSLQGSEGPGAEGATPGHGGLWALLPTVFHSTVTSVAVPPGTKEGWPTAPLWSFPQQRNNCVRLSSPKPASAFLRAHPSLLLPQQPPRLVLSHPARGASGVHNSSAAKQHPRGPETLNPAQPRKTGSEITTPQL